MKKLLILAAIIVAGVAANAAAFKWTAANVYAANGTDKYTGTAAIYAYTTDVSSATKVAEAYVVAGTFKSDAAGTATGFTAEWGDAVVDTNMKGPLYLCREAVRYFLTKDEGNIINISSANGVRPMCGAAYCSTKGGLNTLTKNVAIRCTGTGIRCNAVAPGHTPSPTAYAHDDGGPKTVEMGYMNDIRNARTVRTVHPWEIDQAYAVLFLASDMSRCINGEVLCVDCGCYL